MPAHATSAIRWTQSAPHIAIARVTLGDSRPSFRMPWCSCAKLDERDEARALKRGNSLAAFAQRMSKLDRPLALKYLERLAAAVPGKVYAATVDATEQAIGGHDPRRKASTVPTLDEIEERWYSGELARLYPDDVDERSASTAHKARLNYVKYIKPLLGSYPVDVILRARCDEVKNSLPKRRANSRRQMLMPLKTLLDVCVHPLGLLEHSPLPAKWLPKDGGSRELQFVYPSEESLLMGCTSQPLWLRFLLGLYARSGARSAELPAMAINQFDLVKGTAFLHAHQTKRRKARRWKLDDSTVRACRAWCALARADAKPTDPMFVEADGLSLSGMTIRDLPELLRNGLKAAGVTRSELFVSTKYRRNLVLHDLRASFVTTSKAADKTETWIMQRTGHKTSAMVALYSRDTEQHFRELEVGVFAPLDEAIPELSAYLETLKPKRQASVTGSEKRNDYNAVGNYIVKDCATLQAPDMTKKTIKSTQPHPSGRVQLDVRDASLTLQLEQVQLELAIERRVNERMAQLVATLGEQVSSRVADAAADAVLARLQQVGVVERSRPTLVEVTDEGDERD